MFVIIPHPTEELKLINFQKKVISSINDNNFCLVSAFPFWINFYTSITDLKKAAKNIKAISILKPEWKNNSLCSSVIIENKDSRETLQSTLILLEDIKKSCKEPCIPAGLTEDFPINLKIFRLGIASENSIEHSKAIQESVWCKLA